MFTQLRLGNFKRFQHCHVDLRKINIFVGPNNSGKSSLIAALRLIAQTLDSYDDQVQLLLNGPFGDFGTFRDLVYRNHRGRPLELGFTVQVPTLDSLVPDPKGPMSAISIDMVFKYNMDEREVYAESIIILENQEHLISLKYSKDGRRHNVEKIGKVVVPPSMKPNFSREFRMRHFLPTASTGRLGPFEDSDEPSAYQLFVKRIKKSGDANALRKLSRLSSRLTRIINATDYLGPLRTPPERTYLFSGERRKRIGVGGENMSAILATSGGKRSKSRGDPTANLSSRMNDWLRKSKMAQSAILDPISDRHFEIRIKNFFTGEDQNIADVGFGHSQVLPFLAGGYALASGSTYMAEQPELHLHPRAQAELGDFLFDLYEQDTQTLIETHSEHLILRLQQHVAQGKVSPDDLRIFYVHNDLSEGNSSVSDPHMSREICVIDLDKRGQFLTPWPNGFFPEKLEESKRLAQIRFSHLSL